MTTTNRFLKYIGQNAVQNTTAPTPAKIYWAGSDNTYVGNEEVINNDFFHKGVYWVPDGNDSKFTVELATTDSNGSYIETYGLCDDEVVGSGTPLVILPSNIGLKSSNFSVEVEGRVLFRRPS